MSGSRAIKRSLQAIALALALAIVPAAAALADPQDDLARTIDQSLDGIEFRLTIAPEQAARDLAEQKRRLEMLARQAPEHDAIPGLRERVANLQEEADAATGGADPMTGSAATAAEGLPTARLPAEVDLGLNEVRDLQTQAEDALLRGELPEAASHLDQADRTLADLEQRFADQIPTGHVPLLVAKERLSALQDQVTAAQDGGS